MLYADQFPTVQERLAAINQSVLESRASSISIPTTKYAKFGQFDFSSYRNSQQSFPKMSKDKVLSIAESAKQVLSPELNPKITAPKQTREQQTKLAILILKARESSEILETVTNSESGILRWEEPKVYANGIDFKFSKKSSVKERADILG